MTEVATDSSHGIELTQSAVRKVGELVQGKANPSLMLRVYIEGGGCSGFQYGFAFDEACEEGDTLMEIGDVRVVVDPMSLQYLTGSRVDYKEDLQGSRFIVENPNASTTCGCGASFGI
jgi:iron-sulfur cluster insertion protein